MVKTKRKKKKSRVSKRQQLYQVWRRRQACLCVKCWRTLQKGDRYRTEVFYDKHGAIEADVHIDCRDVHDRARQVPPALPEHEPSSGEARRKLVMSAPTETETTPVADATEAPKKKGTKKGSTKGGSKKGSTKTTKAAGKKSTASTTEAPVSDKKKKGTKSAKKDKASKKTKSTKEAPAKKGAAKKKATGERTGSMAVTVANRLSPIMGGSKKVGSIIKSLASGADVSHKNLELLRDEVKAKGQELREAGKLKQASELSAANSLVRRLERAAR